ncbi:Uncharacterised protein [Shigella sonnei]|nr:Uncharacterised protein [Shigella sonnei]CSF26755.1 Uncharacterised protein [Shigella sonnei]CSF39973.1 Uncharacterised protein [Shigella sonnei]CSF51659.1 Uncharacterised protein [Shigella sonnei]CSF93957.1 Uncharacterised protein [Shigella sonnei]
MMVKTLRLAPFGAVQTHHFFVRQYKFQLAPYQTALTVNRQ